MKSSGGKSEYLISGLGKERVALVFVLSNLHITVIFKSLVK